MKLYSSMFILLTSMIFSFDGQSLGKRPIPIKKPSVCEGTPESIHFTWFSILFHPCRLYNKDFIFNNNCHKKPLFHVNSTTKVFITSNGITLHFFNLKMTGIPHSWGNELTLGFEIRDKKSNQKFKTSSSSEFNIKIKNGIFDGQKSPLNELKIFGPGREGGKNDNGHLIENELQGINQEGNFKFYFIIFSDGKNDQLKKVIFCV